MTKPKMPREIWAYIEVVREAGSDNITYNHWQRRDNGETHYTNTQQLIEELRGMTQEEWETKTIAQSRINIGYNDALEDVINLLTAQQ